VVEPTLTLRPMTMPDLETFERWLHEPHFARWFLPDSTVEAELDSNRSAIRGDEPTVVLIAELDGTDIGWCQWYRWWDYEAQAIEYGALPGEVGIDYGIGDPAHIGHGIGTRFIGVLLAHLRDAAPDASILVGPSAANVTSRRVLEKNGFSLVDVRSMPGEPNASPLALYRLPAGAPSAAR
jgi:aminoglycoside 6'-N-acetyltransferase